MMSKYNSQYYKTIKARGLCTYCHKPSRAGKTLCQPCADKHNASMKQYHRDKTEVRVSLGLCNRCGLAGTISNTKYCLDCQQYISAKWARQTESIKNEVFEHYGKICSSCGENRLLALDIDHISGGGNQHRKSINKFGTGFYYWLKQNGFPEGYQVLCRNCNWIKYVTKR